MSFCNETIYEKIVLRNAGNRTRVSKEGVSPFWELELNWISRNFSLLNYQNNWNYQIDIRNLQHLCVRLVQKRTAINIFVQHEKKQRTSYVDCCTLLRISCTYIWMLHSSYYYKRHQRIMNSQFLPVLYIILLVRFVRIIYVSKSKYACIIHWPMPSSNVSSLWRRKNFHVWFLPRFLCVNPFWSI